jgi:hypothetical protein
VISVMNADGSNLNWSTFLGGWASEEALGLARGADGDLVVVGVTGSDDFPVTNGAFDTEFDWLQAADAFVTKFHLGGSTGLADGSLPAVGDLTASPNPFNPRTTLRFELAAASPVSLQLYDGCGRCVRTLVQGDFPAGSHDAIWNGRDDAGRELAAGTYLAVLRSGGAATARKVCILK